jgi:hypothetical protein
MGTNSTTNMAGFAMWRAAVPDNQDFFDHRGILVDSYTAQLLHTGG